MCNQFNLSRMRIDKVRLQEYRAALGEKERAIAELLARWISQHQNLKYVGKGINVLWDLVAEEA